MCRYFYFIYNIYILLLSRYGDGVMGGLSDLSPLGLDPTLLPSPPSFMAKYHEDLIFIF